MGTPPTPSSAADARTAFDEAVLGQEGGQA